ncbi:hypothetical protein BJX61DRAFT_262588 [Aspergillus egyptiacus]|nr:hypothetical protein BJX61DRAFT_262588 [Aspergillus egyptiacus]
MRFFLPAILLGASSVVAQQSLQDIIEQDMPECLHSCFDELLDALPCDADDKECLCSGDNISKDTITSGMEGFSSCAMNAGCSQSDLESIGNLDFADMEDKIMGICENTDTNTNSNNNNDNNDDNNDDSDNDDNDEDGPDDAAVSLSATNAVLAAGAVMLFAAF